MWCLCCSAWAFACKSPLSQRNKRILRTERDGSDDGEGRFFLKQKEVLMDVAQS